MDPFEWIGKITGSGVSEWREKRIDFDIEGRFDWNTKKVDLVKQHKGSYTNRIRYTCKIVSVDKDEGKSGDGSNVAFFMEGFYAKGKIELSKTRGFSGGVHPSMLSNCYGNKSNNGRKGVSTSSSIGDNEEYGGSSGGSERENLPNPSLSVLEKYETYLAGVIGDGRGLSSQDQMLLANFRSHLGLTEEDHMAALRNMNMSLAEFTTMCESGEEKTDDM